MGQSLSRRKRLAFGAMMVLLTIVLCTVTLEFGLAMFMSPEQSANWNAFHPERGWALIPGQYTVKPMNGVRSFPLSINEVGLRAHRPIEATRVRRRLLVLGDSFTFAREVRTERIFTQQLQDLLVEQGRGDIEVLNAGVPAYGTAQQLLLMRELSTKHRLKPELVLLVFFTNDILDNLCLSYGNLATQPTRPCFGLQNGSLVLQHHPREEFNPADDTLVAAPAARGLRSVAVGRALAEEWIQTRPTLIRLLGYIGIDATVPRMPGLLNGWYRDDVVTSGTKLTGALLRELQRDAAENGSELIVTMVPSPFQVYPETYIPLLERSFAGNPMVSAFVSDRLRPQRIVAQICREASIPFLDLMPTFDRHSTSSLFIPRDGHLTESGHTLVGQSLLEFVVENLPVSAG